MAKKFLVNIDLNKNQLLQPVIEVLGSAPGTPVEGQIYYNSTDETLWLRQSAAWLDLGLNTDTLGTDGDKGDITVGGTGTTLTIDADAVTYDKIQNVVANNVFLGNNSGAGGIVDELTGTEATAMLNLFDTVGSLQGLVPGSSGATTTFLRADGTWASPAGGFANFSAGADVNADEVIADGDVLEIVGGTGMTSTITDVTTTTTITMNLDNTAVTPASYGLAGSVGQFTVDAQGRITTAADVAISITESQISDLGTTVTLNADTDVSANAWVIDEDNMASDDATKVPTQQSVKAYVDSAVTSGMTYKGGYNATTDTPALDTGTPSIEIGDVYVVTVAGTFFTEAVEVGDMLMANNTSTDAAALSDWDIVQTNLDQATESVAGFAAIATAGEVVTGTNDTKFITPLKLEGWDGGTAIVTVGTIATGTWQGDVIGEAYLPDATETTEGVSEIATQGEVTTGTDDFRYITPLKLITHLGETGSLNSTVRYTQTIGDTAATTIVVTHNIGRQFVIAQVFTTASPFDEVECDIEMDTVNATSFTFNTAPGTAEYTVVIIG